MTGHFESVTERTIELKMGRLNSYKGNYTFYLKESRPNRTPAKGVRQPEERNPKGKGIHQPVSFQR